MFRTTLRGPGLMAIGAMLAAITLGTASASPRKVTVDENAMSGAVAFETAVTGVAESVSSSVVSIQVEVSRPANNGLPSFFGGQGQGGIVRGGGSGVILRSNGYILTNNHVVSASKPHRRPFEEWETLPCNPGRRGYCDGSRDAEDRRSRPTSGRVRLF